jgi:hypothetical protein
VPSSSAAGGAACPQASPSSASMTSKSCSSSLPLTASSSSSDSGASQPSASVTGQGGYVHHCQLPPPHINMGRRAGRHDRYSAAALR